MKFLVIGGAGYVGSHFIAEAERQGHTCVVFDNLGRGFRAAVPKHVPLYVHDILDTPALAKVIRDEKPDCVLHYAAFALVAESVAHPELYHRNNVLGTQSMIEAISQADRQIPIVFSSSCAVYGIPDALPITEDTTKQPISPYGLSKWQCEQHLQAFCEEQKTARVTALRYFNACGADQEGHIGEAHEPETHLIPNILKAVGSDKPMTIYGHDFPTRDGTCIRDYIHVTDLARAHLIAADQMHKGQAPGFRALNLGSGQGYTNLEILEMARNITGQEIAHEMGPRRDGDPAELVADPQKAKEILGFETRVSDLETIMTSAWRWHKSHPHGYGI